MGAKEEMILLARTIGAVADCVAVAKLVEPARAMEKLHELLLKKCSYYTREGLK